MLFSICSFFISLSVVYFKAAFSSPSLVTCIWEWIHISFVWINFLLVGWRSMRGLVFTGLYLGAELQPLAAIFICGVVFFASFGAELCVNRVPLFKSCVTLQEQTGKGLHMVVWVFVFLTSICWLQLFSLQSGLNVSGSPILAKYERYFNVMSLPNLYDIEFNLSVSISSVFIFVACKKLAAAKTEDAFGSCLFFRGLLVWVSRLINHCAQKHGFCCRLVCAVVCLSVCSADRKSVV